MDTASVELALAHRLALPDVTFVAITGSCGKTTTKDLATGIVAGALRGTSNPGSGNCGSDVVRQMLRVGPEHEFCLQELGAWGPGTLDEGLGLIRPDVGVVLNVRRDHYSGFGGLTRTQAEKSKVVTCLPAHGTAILNADDALVLDMRHRTRAAVVTFGLHHDADFAAREVRGDWPDRVRFTLLAHGRRYDVQTQLVGDHLVGVGAGGVGDRPHAGGSPRAGHRAPRDPATVAATNECRRDRSRCRSWCATTSRRRATR